MEGRQIPAPPKRKPGTGSARSPSTVLIASLVKLTRLSLSVSVSVSVSYVLSLLCSHRRRTEHAPFHHLTETQNALSPLPTTRTPALVPRHTRRRPRRRHSRELPAPTLQNHQPQIQRRHLAMVGVTGWTQQHRRHWKHCHPPHEPSRHAVLS